MANKFFDFAKSFFGFAVPQDEDYDPKFEAACYDPNEDFKLKIRAASHDKFHKEFVKQMLLTAIITTALSSALAAVTKPKLLMTFEDWSAPNLADIHS